MKSEQIKIGKENVTNQWQVHILARAFDKEQLKEMWSAYKAARLRYYTQGTPPTKAQYGFVAMRKQGTMPREIARHYRTTTSIVNSGIHKVAVYTLLTS